MYSYGPYNKIKGNKQRIRITEGCPNNCPQCYEPTEIKIFGVPEIKKNVVEISDMNLLCKPESLKIIEGLGERRVNNKVIYYELICGIDYRYLTLELAMALKQSRFRKIRFAWDGPLNDQYKIKDAIKILLKAGYNPKNIMVFILCNYKVHYLECCLKLDLLKIWNVQVSDCYFDNQTFPNVKPVHWTQEQLNDFRPRCALHNQLVGFKLYPDLKRVYRYLDRLLAQLGS